MLQDDDVQRVQKLNDAYRRITAELGKVIVGQQQVIEELLIALFARGHCLLVGVPGLAKTLMIRTLADSLSLKFSRIQFTPDLMPTDITGTEVIQEDKATGTREFRFLPGPIFANVILADEINRTPPKTQAALLEAMQEHQVTVGGKRHRLAEPFFVLATQNPIEQEGTYPLPEAQLDRFMFNIFVDYPDEEEEFADRQADDGRRADSRSRRRSTAEEILALAADRAQGAGRRSRDPLRPAVHAAHAAREGRRARLHPATTSVGAPARGPASILVLGAKARAVLHGRYYVNSDDIRAVALPGAAASHHDQLQRRGRRHQARRHHSPPDRNHSRRRRRDAPPVENYQKYLDPQTLAKLQGLGAAGPARSSKATCRACIAARTTASRSSSPSTASTCPGDDLRYVDWKVFGKTDKFYLKQYEEETNLVSYLLLDTSESMRYQQRRRAAVEARIRPVRRRRRWRT